MRKKTRAILITISMGVALFIGQASFLPASANAAPISLPTHAYFADDTVDHADCEQGGLSWLVCPIVDGLAGGSDFLINSLIIPLLQTAPIDLSNTDSNIFKVWSSFRIIANILLVFAILAIVIGQAMGSDLASAYVVKKSVPRLLLAAILVNLSIYLVAIALDVTNVVGMGIGNLMMDPFKDNGGFLFQLNGGAAALSIVAIIGGIWAASTVIAGGAIAALQATALFVLLPLILAILGVFATLILRQGIIMFLVIVSPVAFVLYALPNTEKYFKQWWDLLVKTLLVYPIVIIVLAVSNILAVTVNDSNSTGMRHTLAGLVSLIIMIIPLFLIPFAFKLAGGAIGSLAGTLSGWGKRGAEGIKGSEHDPWSLRNRTKSNARAAWTSGRMRQVNWGRRQQKASGAGVVRRGVGRAVSGAVGFGNLEARDAALNAETEKLVSDVYNTGADNFARAFWAQKHTGPDDPATGRKAGRYYSPYQNANGTYSEVAASDVAKAHSLVGQNAHMLQAYTKYEMSKAADDGQLDTFKQRFTEKANELGMSSEQANAVWGGPKFVHQGARLEQKHTSISGGKGSLQFDQKRTSGFSGQELEYGDVKTDTFSTELADKVRAFDFANLRSSTAKASTEGYTESVAKRDALQAHLDAGGGDYTDGNGKTISAAQVQGELESAEASISNFRDVAGLLRQQQQRGGGTIPAGAGGGDDEHVAGGIGGSARANQAWQEFTNTVLGPPGGP